MRRRPGRWSRCRPRGTRSLRAVCRGRPSPHGPTARIGRLAGPLAAAAGSTFRRTTRREEVAAMTITTTPDRLEELDDLERLAWSAYRESLRNLEGRDYDTAEQVSWEELQRTLVEVQTERAALAAPDLPD